jgi:hypothetical protein
MLPVMGTKSRESIYGSSIRASSERALETWLFGICLGSNSGAQERQAGETGKAVGTNGLQAGWNSQGYQNLGGRLCERGGNPHHGRARRDSAHPRSKSSCKTISGKPSRAAFGLADLPCPPRSYWTDILERHCKAFNKVRGIHASRVLDEQKDVV